jgi:hypothetical protein
MEVSTTYLPGRPCSQLDEVESGVGNELVQVLSVVRLMARCIKFIQRLAAPADDQE